MFCPICRDEYREGFSECAQCEVPLVEQLPAREPIADKEIQWVTVLYSRDMSLISVAKSLLESEGIPYLSSGETLAEVSARVQVRKEDEEEVKALLTELE